MNNSLMFTNKGNPCDALDLMNLWRTPIPYWWDMPNHYESEIDILRMRLPQHWDTFRIRG